MGKQPREMSDKSLRLRAAARDDDGFFSIFVLRKISRFFTSSLVETKIKPNTVTGISIALGLFAAYIASTGRYLTSAIIFLFSLVLDCVDGEIARYKSQLSMLGAWLDALADRVKEFAYIGALAFSTNEKRTWEFALVLVILQTIRHLSDYNFVKMQRSYEENRTSNTQSGALYWIKKVMNLPIGERWLLLAVLPLIVPVKIAFQLIAILGSLSLIYVVIARSWRMLRWPKKIVDLQFLVVQRDTLIPIKISERRISWTLPSFLRGIELVALLFIPLKVSSVSLYLMITTVALWHYTNLYDALQGREIRFGRAGLRVAGRLSLCLLAYIFGIDSEIAIGLSIYLGALIILRGGHNVAKGAV